MDTVFHADRAKALQGCACGLVTKRAGSSPTPASGFLPRITRINANEMDKKLLNFLVHRTASAAIGASTVRKQGAPGVVDAARRSLAGLKLTRYARGGVRQFQTMLDNNTETLKRAFPMGARNWGTARKCLNIFLRDVLYNRYLSEHFEFEQFESHLEIPLDRDVGSALREQPEGFELPRWRTIKFLTQSDSRQFQLAARQVARRLGTHPVHLDLIYWRRTVIATQQNA